MKKLTLLQRLFQFLLICGIFVATAKGVQAQPNDVGVVLKLGSSYTGGFGATINFTNNGSTDVANWTLVCDFDFTVSSLWNANWSKSGNRYTMSDLGWNGKITPGQTVSLGFDGLGTLNATSATNCTLNGSPITVIVDMRGSSGTTTNGGILIGSEDANGVVKQFNINLGVNEFTLDTPVNPNPTYTVMTSNQAGLSAEIIAPNILRLTGLQSGRAGLRLDDGGGNVRYVGVRIRNADGSLPIWPNYVSLGSVSEDSTADLSFWQDIDTDLTNKRMDVRYIYLNGGPVGGWPTWNGAVNEPGGRAISFIRESLKLGMIPAFVYYNIPDSAEDYAIDVAHMQNDTYMKGYFTDLKLAIDIINKEAKDETVVLIFEPDFLGYLGQKGDDPTTMMAKASAAYSSGLLDPATDPIFPDTVYGLVQAINYSVSTKAPYAQFGWQLNLWASPPGGYTVGVPGNGLMHLTDTMGISAGRAAIYKEAAAITDFYIKAGITTHGADFLSIDKYGLDGAALSPNAASDPATSTWFWNSEHWTNYLQFVKAMHDQSQLPIVLWQLTIGHINNSLTTNPYTGGAFATLDNTSTKYEDSAPTYFFGDTFAPGSQARFDFFAKNGGNDPKITSSGSNVTWGNHIQESADVGVISMLFGAGVGASTDGVGSPPTDDYYWITKAQQYYLNPVPLDSASLPPTATPSTQGTPTQTPMATPVTTATPLATATPTTMATSTTAPTATPNGNTPAPTATPIVTSCTDPQYVDGGNYNAGDKVQNIGNRYECVVGGWCSISGGSYEPGVGWAWQQAWTLLGPCQIVVTPVATQTPLPTAIPTTTPSPTPMPTETPSPTLMPTVPSATATPTSTPIPMGTPTPNPLPTAIEQKNHSETEYNRSLMIAVLFCLTTLSGLLWWKRFR